MTQSEKQRESQMKKKKDSNIRGLWENIKRANLHVIGIPEWKDREKGITNVSEEITAENFPNLKNETYPGRGSTEGPK